MNNIVNQYFDKVVCISLKERKDKKEKQKERFDKLGIDVEWFEPVKYGFIPNIIQYLAKTNHSHFNKHQPYEIGAALSHYTVIKNALLEDCKKILVFEDDVLFQKNFNERFEKYMNKVPENWDLLLLYSFMYQLFPQNQRINSKWIKSYKAWSLMSYAANRNFMENYIKRQDQFFTIADLVSFKMQEENFNIYSAVPTLCIPDAEGGSDIRQLMNYETNQTVINMGFGKENFE